jgi:hypothetical protein
MENTDSSLVPQRTFGNVKNGIAFDKYSLPLENTKTIVIPENAQIEIHSKDTIQIFSKKRLGFAGHPPSPISIEKGRDFIGFATQREDQKLIILMGNGTLISKAPV